MEAEGYYFDRTDEQALLERLVQDKMRKQGLILQIESVDDQELLDLLEELNKSS